MKKQTQVFGLKPDQVALLFNIGSGEGFADAKKKSSNQRKADLLKFRLSKVFLPERSETFEISPVTAHLFDVLGSLVGEQAGDIILNEYADRQLLYTVKRYGKALIRKAKTQPDRHVGWVIYYAAIASAYVFQDDQISRISEEKFYHAAKSLKNKSWIPKDIRYLFSQGYLRIKEQRKQEGS